MLANCIFCMCSAGLSSAGSAKGPGPSMVSALEASTTAIGGLLMFPIHNACMGSA